MEYILSSLVLVLNCKFGDLTVKTKERLTGEGKKKGGRGENSKMILHQKILSLWNHSISQSMETLPTLKKIKKCLIFSPHLDFSTIYLYSM